MSNVAFKPYACGTMCQLFIDVARKLAIAGLDQCTFERIKDSKVIELAGKVKYRIDPENEYPTNYRGHIRVVMKEGSVHEVEQPYLWSGASQPMSDKELSEMFRQNAAYGGSLTKNLSIWRRSATISLMEPV